MVLSIRVRAPQIILELRSGRMPRDFTLSQGSNFDLCESPALLSLEYQQSTTVQDVSS